MNILVLQMKQQKSGLRRNAVFSAPATPKQKFRPFIKSLVIENIYFVLQIYVFLSSYELVDYLER